MKMAHPYKERYVTKAQRLIGDAFDYAVNVLKIPLTEFASLFSLSHACVSIEHGDLNYILGKSGVELAIEIIEQTLKTKVKVLNHKNYVKSCEYWIGWAIAYYQWWTDIKFQDLFSYVTADNLAAMYKTLHEADITKFVETMDILTAKQRSAVHLKQLRKLSGLTQKELAEESGVSLRSIQMYEQQNKDINKASANTIYCLSKALGCSMEDLYQK